MRERGAADGAAGAAGLCALALVPPVASASPRNSAAVTNGVPRRGAVMALFPLMPHHAQAALLVDQVHRHHLTMGRRRGPSAGRPRGGLFKRPQVRIVAGPPLRSSGTSSST